MGSWKEGVTYLNTYMCGRSLLFAVKCYQYHAHMSVFKHVMF